MRRNLRKNKAAISPVIATVIIVAVTIAVAISVAFWLGGLSALFTRFERVEFTAGFPTGTAPTFNITLNGKNTGSADATIIEVITKDRPIGDFDTGNFTMVFTVTDPGASAVVTQYAKNCPCDPWTDYDNGVSVAVVSGATIKFSLLFSSSAPVTSGQSLELRLLTSGGQEYGRSIALR